MDAIYIWFKTIYWTYVSVTLNMYQKPLIQFDNLIFIFLAQDEPSDSTYSETACDNADTPISG